MPWLLALCSALFSVVNEKYWVKFGRVFCCWKKHWLFRNRLYDLPQSVGDDGAHLIRQTLDCHLEDCCKGETLVVLRTEVDSDSSEIVGVAAVVVVVAVDVVVVVVVAVIGMRNFDLYLKDSTWLFV